MEMTEGQIAKVQKIVGEADWSACPVPHQGEVQEFVVNGIACLIRGQQQAPPPTEHRPFWQEWAIRAPYAAAAIVIALAILYVKVTGKFPTLPMADVGATEITEVAHP